MILLDTCTLLWLVADQSGLSETAKQVIQKNVNSIYVSSIPAFEIATKNRLGKISLPMPPDEWFPAVLKHHGIEEMPITAAIAVAYAMLPNWHNDLCDRIIIATAKEYNMAILTPDPLMAQYKQIQVTW
jgi:PIN domain nuclease of toxin-antitoxin system